jgi:hypothetical protein
MNITFDDLGHRGDSKTEDEVPIDPAEAAPSLLAF